MLPTIKSKCEVEAFSLINVLSCRWHGLIPPWLRQGSAWSLELQWLAFTDTRRRDQLNNLFLQWLKQQGNTVKIKSLLGQSPKPCGRTDCSDGWFRMLQLDLFEPHVHVSLSLRYAENKGNTSTSTQCWVTVFVLLCYPLQNWAGIS